VSASWIWRDHGHVLPLTTLAVTVHTGTTLLVQDEEASGHLRPVLSLDRRDNLVGHVWRRYSKSAYKKRVGWMVDHTVGVTGFCHGTAGGVPNTIESTRTNGVPVVPVGRASEMVYNA
jgi:hypothetical protein